MAGPVPVDPWSAGFMAVGSVAGAALQKPAMNAQQTAGGAVFDNSGWNVNIGPGASMTASTDRATVPAAVAGLSNLLGNPVILAGLAVALYLILKSK